MCFNKSVADKNAVFLAYEDFFLGKDYAADAICHARHIFTIELSDILVASGRVYASLVAVDAEVERCAVLYYCLVEARQQYMRFIVHPFDWHHKESMLFAGVAADERCAVVCASLIRSQHLFRQRLVQVYEQVLIKFKITHIG